MLSFHIECDHSRTLGGSCTRDLFNLSNHINSYYDCEFHVFTSSPLDNMQRSMFKSRTISFYENGNLVTKINSIIAHCAKSTKHILFHISGHGDNKSSNSPTETDHRDEFIVTNTGIVLDNDFKTIVDGITDKTIRISIICDTCRSGTMFDKIDDRTLYVGACLDNQFAYCDIGELTGFGGLLTIVIIEENLIWDIIHRNKKRLHAVLTRKLYKANQTPSIK